jgi:putative pyoverdin transport system ATP-binding/permease protein
LQTYFTAEDKRQWVILLATSLTAGVAQSLTLAVINDAVATYGKGRSNDLYLPLVIGMIAIAAVAGYYGAVRGHVVSNRMAIRLRNTLLDRLGAANLLLVERVGSSALHYHLMATIDNLAKAYGTMLGFVTSTVVLACNFIYLGWLSPLGLVGAMIVATAGVAFHFRQERRNLERKRVLDALNNELGARHRHVLEGYKELRLSERKRLDYRARIDQVNDRTLVESLEVTKVSTIGDLATHVFQFLVIVLIVFLLPHFASLSAVTIMQLMTAILVTIGPLSGAVGAIPGFTNARIALSNLQMLQREIENTREPTVMPSNRRLDDFKSLELRGIEFSFGAAATGETFHLGPIDLRINRGEVVFLVGGNGSGKTVLMRVLTALYHPSKGAILYNGIEVGPDDRQAYREQFAAVYSEFHLFKELLGDANERADKAAYWIERLGLADKTQLRDGTFSTVALSTGQRKRLAFVVAMLEDRALYVLDEYGAEQDPEQRRRFYRELIPHLQQQGKTIIAVTHDDAYFDAADRVVKMDFGRIVNEHRPAGRAAAPAMAAR